jgi:hypothetical protein
LSLINPVQAIVSHFPKIHSKIIYNLCLGLPSGLITSGFLTKMLYAFLILPCMLHALPVSSSLILSP